MFVKRFFYILLYFQFIGLIPLHSEFINTHNDLKSYYDNPRVIAIASPGRSGSSMLTESIRKCSSFVVLKHHLLPPTKNFKGKTLFIFSNPDQAAESALAKTIRSKEFGKAHFEHMETADRKWLRLIGNTQSQTLEHNLLAYDALGCYKQLQVWLHTRTEPCDLPKAQILAVKYENLWEEETQREIRKFLNLNQFKLPAYRERGLSPEKLLSEEVLFRKTYNLGTDKEPIYTAYDKARSLWEEAPAYQYLKIK